MMSADRSHPTPTEPHDGEGQTQHPAPEQERSEQNQDQSERAPTLRDRRGDRQGQAAAGTGRGPVGPGGIYRVHLAGPFGHDHDWHGPARSRTEARSSARQWLLATRNLHTDSRWTLTVTSPDDRQREQRRRGRDGGGRDER